MLRRQRTRDAKKELFTIAIKLGWSHEDIAAFLEKHPNTPMLEKGIKKLKDGRP
jgi:hypothetical protein